jgi:hypothetical protein
MEEAVSSHADTAAEFRTEIDHLRNLPEDDLASVSVDLLRLAADALDSTVAENQRLREALRETGTQLLDASKGWSADNPYERQANKALALAGDAE